MTMECDRSHDVGQAVEELAMRLCRLLEGQLAAGREGDLSRVEQLGEQANGIVASIVRQEGGAAAIPQDRRRQLKRSYDELTLMLRAEQADVQSRLRQLRKVKRVVGAYRMDR
jgi:hypothetical protein